MATTSVSNVLGLAVVQPASAGWRLRQVRERLGLTLRDVEECSLEIAGAEHNSDFVVSIARLNQIENDDSLPSFFKLYTLAIIYHLTLDQILTLYGVEADRMEQYRSKSPAQRTHLIPPRKSESLASIRFPIRFDPGFRPEKTVFLSRIIESWGEIPLSLLAVLDFKRFQYGYIGLDDCSMTPLIRPGSVVQIDRTRRRVINRGWQTEMDRPIYFVELRYGYECRWCHQQGRELTLIPHTRSALPPRTIRVPDEGEILGQVIGIAMRLVEQIP